MYTKKLFQLVALLMLVSTAVFAQSTTWTGGAGNTDWDNTNNWDGGVPDQFTSAVITTQSFMPALTGAATCLNLTITTGTLTLSGTGANTSPGTLLVYGNVDIQASGTISGGTGTLKFAGNWSRTGQFLTGTGSTIVVNGTGATQTLASTSFYNLTVVTGAVATLNGDLIIGSVLTVAGTLNAGSAAINLTGTSVAPPFVPLVITGTFTPGSSTVNYKNTVATSIAPATYYNLGINRTNFTFTPTGSLTVSNQLSVDAGTFATGAFTHNVRGQFQVAATAIFSATAGSTMNFNGASAQQIALVTYDNVAVNNTSGVSLFISSGGSTGPATLHNLTLVAGTFSDAGNLISLASAPNTLTMQGTSTLKLGSASVATTLPAFTTKILASGTTIEYASSVAQTVLADNFYQNVLFSGSGAKTVNAVTVAGTFTVNSGITLNVTGASTLNGSLVNNGAIAVAVTTGNGFNVAGNTSGATQLIGALTGAGTVTFTSTTAQTVNLGTLNSTGTVNFNTTSGSINFTGSTSTINFKNLTLIGSGKLTPIGNWSTASGGLLTLGTTSGLSINSGITLGLVSLAATAPATIFNGGTVNVTGTSAVFDGYSGSGNLTITASAATTVTLGASVSSTGLVTLAGSSTLAFAGAAPSTLKDLAVTNSGAAGVVTIGNWVVTGATSIGNGTTLNIAGNAWTLGGGVTETGTGKFLGTGAGSLTFNGSGAQTWTLGAARSYLFNVTVGKVSNALVVAGGNLGINQLTFGNTAGFTSGLVNLSNNTLTLANNTIAGTPGSTAHIFSGSVATTVPSPSVAYVFPVGDGTNYAPFILSAPTTTPGFTTVGFVATDPGGTQPSLQFVSTGPSSIQVSRASAYYWTVNPSVSLANVTDLTIDVRRAINDPFQTYDKVRLIIRDVDTNPWTGITGDYTGSAGSGNDITKIVATNPISVALSTGAKKIAYGLASAIVNIGGLVYYGDLAATTANTVGNVGVNIWSSSSAVSTVVLIASGASTAGYNFTNVAGITSGYEIQVVTFPGWAGVTGTSSTDAVAARNTIVGRTTGAITAAETMKIIAADVDNSGGAVVCANATSYTGGEVTFTSSPALTAITAVDVMQLLQRAAGTISSFVRGDFYSTIHRTSATSLLQNLTGQTIRVVAIGDASFSAVPTQLKKQQVLFATEGNVNVDSKKAFMVPIQMTSEKAEVAAFTISVKYPSDKVKFGGIVSSLKGLTAVDKDGYVRMSMIDMTGENAVVIEKGAELASIKFVPKDGFNANSGFGLELEQSHTSFSNNDAQAISLSLNAPRVGAALPVEFELSQNYPNPFNPTTSLNYAVPEVGRVSVKIYNILGEEVANLFNGIQEPGRYTTQWNAGGFASGVYIVRMTGSSATKNFSSVVKIMLLK